MFDDVDPKQFLKGLPDIGRYLREPGTCPFCESICISYAGGFTLNEENPMELLWPVECGSCSKHWLDVLRQCHSELTDQLRVVLRLHPDRCPFCRSHAWEYVPDSDKITQIKTDMIVLNPYCFNCGFEWVEHYQLVGIVPKKSP